MAGFVIVYQAGSSAQQRQADFEMLLASSAGFKQLGAPPLVVTDGPCSAAKLNGPASLHTGIAHDKGSGSWLLAVGTVVALSGDNRPQQVLEDLLRAYMQQGDVALAAVDGHFGLAIYDGRSQHLALISDPMGLFAVYYARRGEQVLISTSALALAQLVHASPDPVTMECFLGTGAPIGEHTLWHEVVRLRPATVIELSMEKFLEHEYWYPQVDESMAHQPMKTVLARAEEVVGRVFDRFLRREGNVWADLTGGFDTRVVTMFLDQVGIPFRAYCVGPDGHPDVQVSRNVSRAMDWDYQQVTMPADWANQQMDYLPLALGRGEGMLAVNQLANVLQGGQRRAQWSCVNITGGGVDEWRYHIFGGNILLASAIKHINYDNIMDTRIAEPLPAVAMAHNRVAEVRGRIRQQLIRMSDGYTQASARPRAVTQIDLSFIRYRHPIHAGAYLSAQAGIMRPLLPFCAKELEELGLSLNHQWRIKYEYRFVRHLLERNNPRLAALPTDYGEPSMPIRLNNLAKFGPFWKFLSNILVGKLTGKVLKRRVVPFPKRHPIESYPLPAWNEAWYQWAIDQGLLDSGRMLSGALYQPGELQRMAQMAADSARQNLFLDRAITLEMALRAAGTPLA